ncbi:hypothetical protein J4G07_11595 [Candidatus Poribacteria bacterium]|nr:hypothetical protein [Candidatus Poribacteria bacterium]
MKDNFFAFGFGVYGATAELGAKWGLFGDAFPFVGNEEYDNSPRLRISCCPLEMPSRLKGMRNGSRQSAVGYQ